MDSKLNIDTDANSSINKKILNQRDVIVISDTDDEPVLESTSNSFILDYKDLQISSSFKSEYNSDNSLEDDDIFTDNLNDNDSFENYLENKDEHEPTFAKFGRDLTVDQVEYYLEFQEYPKTSSIGVASVYNISGWDINDAKKTFGISNIQYAYGDPGNIRSIKKLCEFGSTTLNIEHTSVDFEDQLYKRIFDANEFSVNTFTLKQAYNTPCSYINPTTNIRCNGKPVLKEYKQIDNTTTIQKFIGCQKYQFGQKGHRYIAISHRVNMEYLEQLFQDYTYCSNKISEEGKLINKGSCPVKFYHILPKDLTKCPFIVIIFVGIHNYPPLLPTKTPQNIINNLQKIIENELDLNLTHANFLQLLKQKELSDPYICSVKWVRDKYKPWILARFSLAFTKIDADIWNQTPNNTNVSESAHANINQDGRSLSLLAAIYCIQQEHTKSIIYMNLIKINLN
ncbi:10773_t:CDS:10 [Gigaspora margarita]|uniref:10773_t:CDS:1 n=1 Tax=Gigaspora margarita TaxID=4874 RepID=A0ABN7UQ92_GIGMA|nr:10773_t:CDS:10 [Gigaspora margarita]